MYIVGISGWVAVLQWRTGQLWPCLGPADRSVHHVSRGAFKGNCEGTKLRPLRGRGGGALCFPLGTLLPILSRFLDFFVRSGSEFPKNRGKANRNWFKFGSTTLDFMIR